jgi:DNA-binding helix-hairpin-helix protein with protein kinase domain
MISGIAQSNPNRQKIMEFEAKHRTAEAFYRTNKQRWERDAGDVGFKAKLSELEGVRKKWKDLPMVRQQRLQQLQREVEKQQLARFLEKFTIDQATIPGIGASRKAVLQSYNIETAFDVSSRMAVPGFGPALKEKLMDWRRDMERKFVFNPSRGVDPRDIAALDKDIADQKQKLERSLFAGPGELTQLRNQAQLHRQALEPQLIDACKAMLQAEVDMTEAKR